MTDVQQVPTSEIDLTDRTLYRTGVPHEVFTELRQIGAVVRHPVVEVPGGSELGFWSVVRHHEAQQANRDWETFTAVDGPGLAPDSIYRDTEMLVAFDPPVHTRIRRLLSAGFTPRMVAKLEADIERRGERILDEVGETGYDAIDFVSDVAHKLPMHVIADIVGIPDEDRPWVFDQTDVLLRTFDPDSGIGEDEGFIAQAGLFEYAQQLAERKRAEPTDDIWTQLTQAEILDDDGNAQRLTSHQLDAFFMILSVAGSETTRNALSQGLAALIDQPEQFAGLRADPELVVTGADEVLRWSSPVLMFTRTATRDTELGGAAIQKGDRVAIWYPSANRDELVFEDPFRFDLARTPNPHVAFGGGGPHYCLGANLARKEIQVMLAALARRFTAVELLGEPQWMGAGPVHNVGVSLLSLPVRLVEG